MSLPKPANLYESLLQRGSVSRMGAVTVMRMDGSGALVTSTQTFSTAMRWGQGRPATANFQKDRSQFLERIDILISKTGSAVATRGSVKPLLQLMRDMESVGLDPMDWSIPSAVQEALKEESKTHGVKKAPVEPVAEDTEKKKEEEKQGH